jgi:uncharacterized delta-60 repeat protein
MGGRTGQHRVSPARPAILLALIGVLALFAAPAADAAEGLLDPTFGSGGFTLLDEPALPDEHLSDVVVLPDGKILAGGSRGSAQGFLLARFNPDGTPDLSFGPGGIRVEPDGGGAGNPRSINEIALTGDGRIVAAGLGHGPEPEKSDSFAIGRYLPSGVLDFDFGHAGLAVTDSEAPSEGQDMDLAPDGKVVVSGYILDGSAYEPAVLRLTAEGDPDTTFAPAAPVGFRHFKVPDSSFAQARAVRVLGDSSIVVGGEAEDGGFLAKLDSEGQLVNGFGNAGFVVEDLGQDVNPSGAIEDIAIQPDGRIVAVGTANTANEDDEELVVARFTAGGDLDPSFGTGGIFRLNPTLGEDEGVALSVIPDGRIVIAGLHGQITDQPTGDTWVLRLTPNGQLDPSFGSGGQTFASASPGFDSAYGLAVQPDGRPVIVGEAENPATGQYEALAGRFTGPEPVRVSLIPSQSRCAGRNATIVGTGTVDKLKGTKKADVIVGLGGADTIRGLAGNDVVCGGPGKDTINGGPGKDTLLGEAGRDRLLGGPGKKDLCNGGLGNDVKKAGGCERKRKLP